MGMGIGLIHGDVNGKEWEFLLHGNGRQWKCKKLHSRLSVRHKNQCRNKHLARRATPNNMEITHLTHIKHIRIAVLQKMIPFHFFR